MRHLSLGSRAARLAAAVATSLVVAACDDGPIVAPPAYAPPYFDGEMSVFVGDTVDVGQGVILLRDDAYVGCETSDGHVALAVDGSRRIVAVEEGEVTVACAETSRPIADDMLTATDAAINHYLFRVRVRDREWERP